MRTFDGSNCPALWNDSGGLRLESVLWCGVWYACVPVIVPGNDQDVYLVLDDFGGRLGVPAGPDWIMKSNKTAIA